MRPIDVQTESLTQAARDLWNVAAAVARVRDGIQGAGNGVAAGAGSADAGAAFEDMLRAWKGSLASMAGDLTQYERNTETAAVVYQQADRSAMPSTPPPPPKPKPQPPSLFGPDPRTLEA